MDRIAFASSYHSKAICRLTFPQIDRHGWVAGVGKASSLRNPSPAPRKNHRATSALASEQTCCCKAHDFYAHQSSSNSQPRRPFPKFHSPYNSQPFPFLNPHSIKDARNITGRPRPLPLQSHHIHPVWSPCLHRNLPLFQLSPPRRFHPTLRLYLSTLTVQTAHRRRRYNHVRGP